MKKKENSEFSRSFKIASAGYVDMVASAQAMINSGDTYAIGIFAYMVKTFGDVLWDHCGKAVEKEIMAGLEETMKETKKDMQAVLDASDKQKVIFHNWTEKGC